MKSEKAITLVILVITIILLLILTSITVTYTIKEGSLFTSAKKSKFDAEVVQILETMELIKARPQYLKKGIDNETLTAKLQEEVSAKIWNKYSDFLIIGRNNTLYYLDNQVNQTQKTWLEELGILSYVEIPLESDAVKWAREHYHEYVLKETSNKIKTLFSTTDSEIMDCRSFFEDFREKFPDAYMGFIIPGDDGVVVMNNIEIGDVIENAFEGLVATAKTDDVYKYLLVAGLFSAYNVFAVEYNPNGVAIDSEVFPIVNGTVDGQKFGETLMALTRDVEISVLENAILSDNNDYTVAISNTINEEKSPLESIQTYKITKYNGNSNKIIIPSIYAEKGTGNLYTVDKIASRAFAKEENNVVMKMDFIRSDIGLEYFDAEPLAIFNDNIGFQDFVDLMDQKDCYVDTYYGGLDSIHYKINEYNSPNISNKSFAVGEFIARNYVDKNQPLKNQKLQFFAEYIIALFSELVGTPTIKFNMHQKDAQGVYYDEIKSSSTSGAGYYEIDYENGMVYIFTNKSMTGLYPKTKDNLVEFSQIKVTNGIHIIEEDAFEGRVISNMALPEGIVIEGDDFRIIGYDNKEYEYIYNKNIYEMGEELAEVEFISEEERNELKIGLNAYNYWFGFIPDYCSSSRWYLLYQYYSEHLDEL